MLQTVAPDHLRVRGMSVTLLFFDGSIPLGYLLMGWLSGLYGAPIAMLIGALFSLVVAGAGRTWRKPTEEGGAASASWEVSSPVLGGASTSGHLTTLAQC